MLFSQFQSLRVTNIDYRERYTGGKPGAGECRAGTFIMRLRTAAGNKKTNKCLWNIVEVKAGVNRHGPVLQASGFRLFGQTDEYYQHFEQLRHVRGLVKRHQSDWITHNSCSHRYLNENLMQGCTDLMSVTGLILNQMAQPTVCWKRWGFLSTLLSVNDKTAHSFILLSANASIQSILCFIISKRSLN